jgi:hypothetical protein
MPRPLSGKRLRNGRLRSAIGRRLRPRASRKKPAEDAPPGGFSHSQALNGVAPAMDIRRPMPHPRVRISAYGLFLIGTARQTKTRRGLRPGGSAHCY